MKSDTIVLSGGGMRGILMLGGLQYLVDAKQLHDIKTFVGTSVGAILSFLICIGYTPIEILSKVCAYERLKELSSIDIRGMLNGAGATSFDIIGGFIEDLTLEKLKYIPTLNDIREDLDKNLIICTYNLSMSKPEYLNPDDHPSLSCIDAIQMSSNIPFIFKPFLYNDSYYIDGGLADNIPIHIGEKYGETLAINLGATYEDDHTEAITKPTMKNLFRTLFIPFHSLFKYKSQQAKESTRIINMNYTKVHFLEFNLSTAGKLDMFTDGYRLMEKEFVSSDNN